MSRPCGFLLPLFATAMLQALFTSSLHAAESTINPATDAIFGAFEKHSLVGLGEYHEMANALAFYAKLLRDPRFAATVGNVVVEFGASQHQAILDRYVAGKHVPYQELSKVWRDSVAWDPTVTGVGYQTFFAQVRAVNLTLPTDRRIRVLLSEPPIRWSRVTTRTQWQRVFDQRARYAASVIAREVLDLGKKALVIYGAGHFFSSPWPSTLPAPAGGTASLGELLQRTHPGALFAVTIYGGYPGKPACASKLEQDTRWPPEIIVSPIRGTPLEAILMRPECGPSVQGSIDPPVSEDEQKRIEHRYYEIDMGVAGDALLYLAPASELLRTPYDVTTYMDEDYRLELARRTRIRGAEPLSLPDLLPLVSRLPRYQWTRTR